MQVLFKQVSHIVTVPLSSLYFLVLNRRLIKRLVSNSLAAIGLVCLVFVTYGCLFVDWLTHIPKNGKDA
ncbi:MAG: hypothetical protein ACETWM_14030 [Candidatus Lokiarchaeia archaeon]